ncbi:MAG: RIP metalloprotease RseP, partial [Pseudomonadota bacterium]|nr:RIP metalloprotease RseP [Pseudomonadota bacterium]
MNNLLISLLALAVTLGVLIAFHEFGHFWVARRLGVKVLRFSVGFGRPLWRRRGRVDDTEFVLAAIPLGGYVRMLDEREGAVAAEERHRAFNRQPVGSRIAIVAAGPLFNFLFAVVAYSLIFMVGVPAMRPLISDVTPGSRAAEAGFQASDVIVAVNGDPTPSMQSVLLALLESAMDREMVTVQVQDADGRLQQRSLDLRDAADLPQNAGLLPSLGFELPSYPPVIGGLVEDGAAAAAGFAPGDRIVEVDGQPVDDWGWWAGYVRERPGKPLEVVVDRQGRRLALTVVPREVQSNQGRIGQIGAYVQE